MKNILCLFLLLCSIQVRAQFVEEVGALESLYESKARIVLNSFLRPQDYTVVVAAEIDRDQKKMDDYREKMEIQYLPGLPIPSDSTLTPANNDLHSMKNKVNINLVLNTDVTAEKESILKTVLMSKLHLDESTGDSISITRAKLPSSEDIVQKPHVLPEFSWKTWGLIVLLSLILLAAAIFWFNARKAKEKDQQKDLSNLQVHPVIAAAAQESAEEKEAQALAEVEAALTDYQKELADLKDQMLYLVTQYPQIASKTVSEMLDKSEEHVIRVFEYLSWDLSRKIFSTISPRTWGRLGLLVKARSEHPTTQQYHESFELVYRAILARFLESGAEKDESNPFAFVFRLTALERKDLLSSETAVTYAMISLFAQADDLKALTETAPLDIQNQIPSEISKLENFPEASLNAVANKLKERLKAMKESPKVSADGLAVAARVLRSYSPVRESEIFAKMKTEDADGAAKIRRQMVVFDDLTIYPTDLVSPALALMDIDDLAKILFGTTEDARGIFFAMMPSKRAKMVERDLEANGFNPSALDVAQTRRELSLKVEEIIQSRGQTLEQVWAEIDQRGGRPQLKMVG